MHKIIFFFLIALTFLSCSSEKTEKEKGAWFGGEIINPHSNYIVLTRNEKLIDSIPLDNNNRFLYYIENVEKGIYNFLHHEYQMVYIEPGDSLMLRLNTIDFDESLAFSGKGSERNNFLINMFIYNEEESQRMRPFYQLPVEAFLSKLDSMRNLRLENLNRFVKRVKPCDEFFNVAKANINYDYFDKREIYPYAHLGRNNVANVYLPDGYYDFRNNIDYNSEALQSYYTYYRFLLRHFDFITFETYRDVSHYDSGSLTHISNKLNAIDSLVNLEDLKNSLLKTSLRRYIINCKVAEDEKKALQLYFSLSTNETHKKEMKSISEASLKLMPGNQLPNLTIVDYNDNKQALSSVINKPTVIYFWSVNSVNHFRNVHSKVDELKLKYPEFDFIAFNTNSDPEAWKRIINRHGYNKNFEFRFDEPEIAIDHLVINSINKTMIVNLDGKIIDNHTNLFSVTFEEQLLGILNQ
jgi:hypothetical protein